MKKINRKNLHIDIVEFSIVFLMWMIALFAPLIIGSKDNLSTQIVLLKSWSHIAPFFILFFINHFIMIPNLLFKRRLILYGLASIVLITVFSAWEIKKESEQLKKSVTSFSVVKFEKIFFDTRYMNLSNKHAFVDKNINMKRDVKLNNKPKIDLEIESLGGFDKDNYQKITTSIFRAKQSPFIVEDQLLFYMRKNPSCNWETEFLYDHYNDKPPIKPVSFFSIIIMIIVFILSTGLRVIFQWIKLDQDSIDRENESIKNELNFLRNQINPHFFMNTLNNIHSLVDFDTDKAQIAIVEFSKLMRYMLYDSDTDKTTLEREIDFLQNYINLMKLRLSDSVEIEVKVPSIIPNIEIPPLLFTSIVENSFKHGVSYQNKSFIKIEFIVEDNFVEFKCVNSNFPKVSKEQSGIGLINTRKRLDIIYNKKYELEIDSNSKIFNLTLRIPYDKMYSN